MSEHDFVQGAHTIGDGDFHHIRQLVRERLGITLAESKRHMVCSRLTRRLRALGLGSFSEYCRLLDTAGDDELGPFADAITTNKTGFFREPHHFERLRSTVLEPACAAGESRLRIWSAGCSSGEEPYSIAMTLLEVLGPASGIDAKVLATDINGEVLDKARAGIYPGDAIEAVPERYRRWLLRGKGRNQGNLRIAEEARAKVTFKRLNLMDVWPMRGPFDAIFCRNVVIYFDKEVQRVLFDRMADLLRPEGYLFIGHAESLFKVTDRFEGLGGTAYRRRR